MAGEKIAPREIDEVLDRASRGGGGGELRGPARPGARWSRRRSSSAVRRRRRSCSRFCREHLADFKIPPRLHIVECIPRAPTGKIQRRCCAEQLEHGMRIAIVGAGATGGFLGARLARAGGGRRPGRARAAPGRHARAGLRLIEPDGESVVAVEATDDLSALRGADAVILTLKAHSLPAMAARLAATARPRPVVVSAQNGIPWWYFQRHGGELDGTRLRTVDPGGVIAARSIRSASSAAWSTRPRASSLRASSSTSRAIGFSLGELDGSRSERMPGALRALIDGGPEGPGPAADPPGDLAQAARQRRLQPV